jgi:hypothetical protein
MRLDEKSCYCRWFSPAAAAWGELPHMPSLTVCLLPPTRSCWVVRYISALHLLVAWRPTHVPSAPPPTGPGKGQ